MVDTLNHTGLPLSTRWRRCSTAGTLMRRKKAKLLPRGECKWAGSQEIVLTPVGADLFSLASLFIELIDVQGAEFLC